MAMHLDHDARRRRPLTWALLIGAFAGATALGACSRVPDAVNPASWYRGTVDFFAGDDKAEKKDGEVKEGLAADRGKPPPGADKPFPKLASVDQQARAREPVAQGLGADPDRPKYAPAIKRQGATPEAIPPTPAPAPAPPVAATMPPPAAAPTTPVIPAPVAAPVAQPPAVAQAPAIPEPTLPPITTDQKEQEVRLTRQLAEIRARAGVGADLPQASAIPAASGDEGTIVVSSQGIQTIGDIAAASQVLTPAQAGSAQVGLRPVLPIPSSAVRVATILFENGSSRLKANDKRILNAVTRLYRKSGGTLRIVGHASSRTRNLSPVHHKMANFKVSVDRADNVAGELVRLGVRQENIVIAAVSDTEPMYYEFMPSGEAGNRRTEIYLEN